MRRLQEGRPVSIARISAPELDALTELETLERALELDPEDIDTLDKIVHGFNLAYAEFFERL